MARLSVSVPVPDLLRLAVPPSCAASVRSAVPLTVSDVALRVPLPPVMLPPV